MSTAKFRPEFFYDEMLSTLEPTTGTKYKSDKNKEIYFVRIIIFF